ncbi:squalene--hopene cyclase [Rosistilla oblonga]|uniref:squalene--hopene cyclase n=1 Tax=Rosistilla oblonga TaxID=2527990 RepID=UPI003A97DCBD
MKSITDSTLAQTPWLAFLAVMAMVLVVATWVLWRRQSGRRRPKAAIACAVLSVLIHSSLFWFVPTKDQPGKGTGDAPGEIDGNAPVMVTIADVESFDPDQSASLDETPETFVPPLELPTPEADPQPAVVTAPAPSELPMQTSTDPPEFAAEPIELNETHAQIDQMMTDLLLADATLSQADAPEPMPTPEPPMPKPAAATPQPTEPLAAQPASAASGVPVPTQTVATPVASPRPDDFANRRGPARRSALIATGGDDRTEAAVAGGLRFIASRQRPDGIWDPTTTGAGQERMPLGENRNGAGKRAETGLTGLALLSLMGSGYTHLEGPYNDNVARGLQALLNRQANDGSMGGPAGTYARMYCHSIATLSLGEAFALTRDPRLAQATADALSYSARIQHPSTGGWRYQPGDTGDTSQFGWQAMAMESGKQGGMNLDPQIDHRLRTFLSTVRAGRGGLASYRPKRPPSRTMTAEALASRLLLGHYVPPAEIAEAEAYILQELPGMGEDNFYYWYYASLALHQLQSPAWTRWNEAMKRRLLATQRSDGSWPTTSVWGGYGGEVYTTAMGCLCLEVYYRHLTLHQAPEKIANGAVRPLVR